MPAAGDGTRAAAEALPEPEKITYSRAARLRVAVSELAAEMADSARGLVPAYADRGAYGGELAESASQLAAMARELLTLAVACERRRGTSWTRIGGDLSVSRQSVHERFAAALGGLDDALTTVWLLGDDPRQAGSLPEGAADPATVAARLDRWATRNMQETDVLAQQDADTRARPVSAGLEPMDLLEQSTMITNGAHLISETRFAPVELANPAQWDANTRALEIGLARRKIELYERMLADGALRGLNGGVDVEDLLAGARARLAELEAQ